MSSPSRKRKRKQFKGLAKEQRQFMSDDEFDWTREEVIDPDRYLMRSKLAFDSMDRLREHVDNKTSLPKLTQIEAFNHVTMVELFILYSNRTILELLRFIEQPGVGKRWTYEETEQAVNMRADGRSIEAIALHLNRSAASVAQRISQAVGIKQLEVKIRGVINGDLEGKAAAGMFEGTLRKK